MVGLSACFQRPDADQSKQIEFFSDPRPVSGRTNPFNAELAKKAEAAEKHLNADPGRNHMSIVRARSNHLFGPDQRSS